MNYIDPIQTFLGLLIIFSATILSAIRTWHEAKHLRAKIDRTIKASFCGRLIKL